MAIAILTLEERRLRPLEDLIPHKSDRTPVALDVHARLHAVIKSAMKVENADKDVVQLDFDNYEWCQAMLKKLGCNEQECAGKGEQRWWEKSIHLFFHLLTVCTAWKETNPKWGCHDGIQLMRNKDGEVGAACRFCTGGVMDNLQRNNFSTEQKEYFDRIKKEEEARKKEEEIQVAA